MVPPFPVFAPFFSLTFSRRLAARKCSSWEKGCTRYDGHVRSRCKTRTNLVSGYAARIVAINDDLDDGDDRPAFRNRCDKFKFGQSRAVYCLLR